MARIKMHISNVKLPFYPTCEVKYGLQNKVSTSIGAGIQALDTDWASILFPWI